jgi:hypothetical protein
MSSEDRTPTTKSNEVARATSCTRAHEPLELLALHTP